MTDGPFRNLKLESHLKRLAEAVQNEAFDDTERSALASDALVKDILEDAQGSLRNLQEYARRKQHDLDPRSSIRDIFGTAPRSPFVDGLQKQVDYRLSRDASPDTAISEGLEAAVRTHIGEVRTRIQEACIHAHQSGEMQQDQFDNAIHGVDRTLDSVNVPAICDALRAGNKDAFKEATAKKKGLDEGPSL